MKKIVTIIIIGFCLGLLSQDSINLKSFDEKIKELEKKNVYWSVIKGDDKKISKDKLTAHLTEYRNKIIDILGKKNDEWNEFQEHILSRLYYHKININKYQDIEKLFMTKFRDLFDDKFSTYENFNSYLLADVLFSDVIVTGKIVDKKDVKLDEDTLIDGLFWEYIIRPKEILYSDEYYIESIKNELHIYDCLVSNDFGNNFKDLYRSGNLNGVFFCSKFGDEYMERINNYDTYKSLGSYFKKENAFPLGGCEEKNDSLVTLIKNFIKLNDYDNFYNRSYK